MRGACRLHPSRRVSGVARRRDNYESCYSSAPDAAAAAQRVRDVCATVRQWAGDTYERQLKAMCEAALRAGSGATEPARLPPPLLARVAWGAVAESAAAA